MPVLAGLAHARGALARGSNTCLAYTSHAGVGSPGRGVLKSRCHLIQESWQLHLALLQWSSVRSCRGRLAGSVGGVRGVGEEEEQVGCTCSALPGFSWRVLALR